MRKVELMIDEILYPFYERIGKNVGKTAEQVMSDALFKLAGELSYEAIAKTKKGKK